MVADLVSEGAGEPLGPAADLAGHDAIVLGLLVALTWDVRRLAHEVRIADVAYDEGIDAVVGHRPVGDEVVALAFAPEVVRAVGFGRRDEPVQDPADAQAHLPVDV